MDTSRAAEWVDTSKKDEKAQWLGNLCLALNVRHPSSIELMLATLEARSKLWKYRLYTTLMCADDGEPIFSIQDIQLAARFFHSLFLHPLYLLHLLHLLHFLLF